jgi:hypothetical protein
MSTPPIRTVSARCTLIASQQKATSEDLTELTQIMPGCMSGRDEDGSNSPDGIIVVATELSVSNRG